jgi:hypothetical protein
MRTVEFVTVGATLVGTVLALISLRHRRADGTTPIQRWRARRPASATRSDPE